MSVVLVGNVSGNVGKSFLSRNVVLPIFEGNNKLLEVESVNASGGKIEKGSLSGEYERISPDDIEKVVGDIFYYDNLVIDVGASSALHFIENLNENGISDEITHILVPSVPSGKEVDDSLNFIKHVIKLWGEEFSERIIFFLNKVEGSGDYSSKILEPVKQMAASIVYDKSLYVPKVDTGALENYKNLLAKGENAETIRKKMEEIRNDAEMSEDQKKHLLSALAKNFIEVQRSKKMYDFIESAKEKLAIYIT